ncbi:DUF433 domain-containing protein [Oscillatoria laete-virens NRMC-F 0139]|nr:DUF433 domain-containing protein [Oscillatoria laete-virens NRMC-F 0139]
MFEFSPPRNYHACVDRIESHPDICNGKPVVKGTRITVSTILEFLSAGDSHEDILKGYPQLSREDILACLQYAQKMTQSHSLLPLAP